MTEKYDPISVIARHDNGQFRETLREQMQAVVRDVVRYGGRGEVSVKLTFKANGERGLTVVPESKVALPKRVVGEAFYYPSDDDQLQRQPPEDEADQLLRPVQKEA